MDFEGGGSEYVAGVGWSLLCGLILIAHSIIALCFITVLLLHRLFYYVLVTQTCTLSVRWLKGQQRCDSFNHTVRTNIGLRRDLI